MFSIGLIDIADPVDVLNPAADTGLVPQPLAYGDPHSRPTA
jgi:hypothetical protein